MQTSLKAKKKKISPAKRSPGQVTQDGRWLVLTDSTSYGDNNGYTSRYVHSCGATIKGVQVFVPSWSEALNKVKIKSEPPNTVPYCPKCEKKPSLDSISSVLET